MAISSKSMNLGRLKMRFISKSIAPKLGCNALPALYKIVMIEVEFVTCRRYRVYQKAMHQTVHLWKTKAYPSVLIIKRVALWRYWPSADALKHIEMAAYYVCRGNTGQSIWAG
jgi:hypothetical protein